MQADASAVDDTPDAMVSGSPDANVPAPDAPVAQPDAPIAQPDAPVSEPDAMVASPDAMVASPDATVGSPDATVASPDAPAASPDAMVAKPDAMVGSPDASVPPPDAQLPPDAEVPPDAQVTPGPPTGVTASAVITHGAIVRWTAPATTGMSAISGYVITATCGNYFRSAGADEDATEYVFSLEAVAAGTQCTFSVHAVNGQGDGAESTSTPSVALVDGPQPPEIVACGGQNRVFLVLTSEPQAGVHYNVYRSLATGVSKINGTKTTFAPMPYTDKEASSGTPYYYVVAAVNGSGVESLDSVEVTATATTEFHDAVFVSSQASGIFISDCMSNIPAGETRVTRKIFGDQTMITGGHNSYNADVFIDINNERLYTTTGGSTPGVMVWDNAGSVDGNVAPTRALVGSFTGFKQPRSIFVDTVHNRLYVADYVDQSIRIWNNADTIDGNVAPAAIIKNAAVTAAGQIYVHNSVDTLWMGTGPAAIVYSNASELTGNVTKEPNRTLTFPTSNVFGVWLETSDNRLFVGANNIGGRVYEVANAASANGQIDPTATLLGPALDSTSQVQIRNGTLYVLNDLGDYLRIFDDANTLDGKVAPTKSIGIGTTAGVGFSVVPQ